jgi:hypothetical protein
MKYNHLLFWCMGVLLLASITANNSYAQTAGTFTFNITTTSTGGYSPKNLIAIWIENNSAAFVKTKLKQSSISNLDHLAIWTGKSGYSEVDATSGATRTAHGPLTVIWNGTDISGNLVPDGTYNVWVEMAWAASLTTGKTSTSFTFTKGSATFHSAPASSTNFSAITLDWVPNVAATPEISESLPLTILPNPTTGPLTIDFKQVVTDCRIGLSTVDGKEIYHESLKRIEGSKILDLSKFSKGVYFISIQYGNKNVNYRVVKI